MYQNTAPMIRALRSMQGTQGSRLCVHFRTKTGTHSVLFTQAELAMNPGDDQLDALLQIRMKTAEERASRTAASV
jgi:hypothetical protein